MAELHNFTARGFQIGSINMLALSLVMFISIIGEPCEGRTVFVLPTLDQDTWTHYNNEVKMLLGPLHFDASSGNSARLRQGNYFHATWVIS